jgi:hypothetical protein
VLVLGAAVAAGLLGVGLSGGRRVGLIAVPVIVVLGVVVLGGLVMGDRGPAGEEEPARQPTTTTPSVLPPARLDPALPGIRVVQLRAADGDGFSQYAPISALVPGEVVRIQAEGFRWSERGQIEQCVVELARQTACAEGFPVRFEDGRADFQVAVRAISPGGCRVGQPTCLLRLTGTDSGRQAAVQTVLVDNFSPGQIRVEPARDVADGQAVQVSVTGFPPGTTAVAVLCAPPEPYDARRCNPPDPASTFTVDDAGAGRTSLQVASGRLGPAAVLCGPRRGCGVAVVVGSGFVAAAAAPVAFAEGPGVDYTAGRVAPGVIGALVLIGLALGIARRTDWRKPTEAATPEMDAADLRADQGLDDLFGTDEELDARDPMPW